MFTRKEIVSSTEVSKNFGRILSEVKKEGKRVVSRNNRIEAVILSIVEYENLKERIKKLEEKDLLKIVEKGREEYDKGKAKKTSSLEELD